MEFTNRQGKVCSPAQYIAELVCARKGKKQNIPMIDKFWQQPEWKTYYQRQIGLAHGLLKLFDAESIIIALNSKDGNWIFSLGTPKLISIIQNIHDSREREKKIEEYKNTEPNIEIKFEEQAVQEVAQIRQKKNSILKELE